MILTGTYKLPQFSLEITNPELTVKSKKFIFDSEITEVDFMLSVTGATYGGIISAPNANGGSANINSIEQFVKNELEQYKI